MSTYVADLIWERGDESFVDQRYSRRHRIRFDGGTEVAGSSSPHVVRAPLSDPAAVDPEEMFVASLSSCHLLWFLALAAKEGWRVDRYEDAAEGVLARNEEGHQVMTVVTLRPRVVFSGERTPDPDSLRALHHDAHARCYIANSVRTEVRVEPVL